MSDRVIYEHRQIGWLTFVLVFGLIVVLSVAIALSARTEDQLLAYRLGAMGAGVVGGIFSSLTIRITEQSMAWWFAIPAIGRRIALSEIASIAPTKTNFWEGWGIHLTFGHGWLWNVAGFNAVEIRLRSGTRFAVGTPEPQAVLAAIERARSGTMRA